VATTAVTVERDRSVDVLRGLLVVLLVFVEWLVPPGYEWLRHSPWDGVRIADFVFPGYLFVVGASMAVARREPAWPRVVRRLLLLLALGLVFNAFTTTEPLRFTGVAADDGIGGFLATVVTRFARRADDVLLVAGALLLAHGLVLSRAWDLDRWVLPDERLYRQGDAGHDPEGVLACVLGATALVLLGFAATRLRSWPFALGLLGVSLVAFLAWEPNKRAWTPTFTLLMAGTFAVTLVALRPVARWMPLLDRVGRNALLVYLVQHAVREVVEPAPAEPLWFAIGAAAVFCGAAALLDRLGVRLRV